MVFYELEQQIFKKGIKMKKSILLLALLLTAFSVTSAKAGAYFGGRFGYDDQKLKASGFNEDDHTWFGSGMAGYRKGMWRFEAMYSYEPSKQYANHELKTISHVGLGMIYLQRSASRAVVLPYIGVGAGVARNRIKETGFASGSSTEFAWGAALGTELRLSKGFFLDVGGRYMDLGSAKLKNKITNEKEDFDLESWGGYAGFRFEY